MIKRFFTWGYYRFVFLPDLQEQLNEVEYVVEWKPDPELVLEIESKHSTKH